jgi:hypothetical protein
MGLDVRRWDRMLSWRDDGVATLTWWRSDGRLGIAARTRGALRAPFLGYAWRILFSRKDDWEPGLREAFATTRHALTFSALTEEHARAHDMVVPLTIGDLEWMSASAELVLRNPLPIPSLHSLRLCNDKLALNRLLLDSGFAAFVPGIDGPHCYPYILKKRIDESGAHSFIIGSWNQERRFAEQLDDPEYFCQELVHGQHEYATHLLFNGGRVLHELTIRYEFRDALPIKGRSNIANMCKVEMPECTRIFAAILERIGFRGMCCVNYKLDDNRPRIFEINPRIGSSACPYLPQFLRALASPLARAIS